VFYLTLWANEGYRMEINVSFDRPEEGAKSGPVTLG